MWQPLFIWFAWTGYKMFLILLTVLSFRFLLSVFWNEQRILSVYFQSHILPFSFAFQVTAIFASLSFLSRGTINLFDFLIAYSCNLCFCLVGDLKRVGNVGGLTLITDWGALENIHWDIRYAKQSTRKLNWFLAVCN